MEGMEIQLHVFSTAAADGGELSAYSNGALLPLSVEKEARWFPELV
jgi:hypothetical protein